MVNDWGFELNNIRVPVTFWHGESDTNVPLQWAELMTENIDGAILVKYPNEGHLLIFKHSKGIFMDLRPNIVN